VNGASRSRACPNLEEDSDDSLLEDLSESIASYGVLQPVIVRKGPDGGLEVVAGQRRLLAVRAVDQETIPAIVVEASDNKALLLSLTENIHRARMHPLDQARAYQAVFELEGGNRSAAADRINKSITHLNQYLDLLKLSPDLSRHLAVKNGPAQVATLSRLARDFPDHDKQELAYMHLENHNMATQTAILREAEGDIDRLERAADRYVENNFKVITIPPELVEAFNMIKYLYENPDGPSAHDLSDALEGFLRRTYPEMFPEQRRARSASAAAPPALWPVLCAVLPDPV
jgi:ParB/RepB/Spo0J family partition protein